MSKSLNTKENSSSMNLEQATTYLKKINEWESVWRFDRNTILGWANFLKDREKYDDVSTAAKDKRSTKTTRRVSSAL